MADEIRATRNAESEEATLELIFTRRSRIFNFQAEILGAQKDLLDLQENLLGLHDDLLSLQNEKEKRREKIRQEQERPAEGDLNLGEELSGAEPAT